MDGWARAETHRLKCSPSMLPLPLGVISLLARQTRVAPLISDIWHVFSFSDSCSCKISLPSLSFCLVRAPFDKYCMGELFHFHERPLGQGKMNIPNTEQTRCGGVNPSLLGPSFPSPSIPIQRECRSHFPREGKPEQATCHSKGSCVTVLRTGPPK